MHSLPVFRRGIRTESFSRIFIKESSEESNTRETTRDREPEAKRRIMINLSKKFIVLPGVWGLPPERLLGLRLPPTEQEDRLLGGVRDQRVTKVKEI